MCSVSARDSDMQECQVKSGQLTLKPGPWERTSREEGPPTVRPEGRGKPGPWLQCSETPFRSRPPLDRCVLWGRKELD